MNLIKSFGAVIAGFVTVVVLSVGIDFILEAIGFFPPATEPDSYSGWMLFIALVYRCGATIAGGYVSARLAPNRPMRHAVILGFVGIVAGTLGAIVNWNLTPHHWYPVALVITALPCTWYGGTLKANKTGDLAAA